MGVGRIKGLTIEIGGDTTGLDKALQGTNKEIKNTQEQLRDVNRLLKFDPKNTELLRQKHRLLKEEVGQTKDKLDTLKTAQKQVKAEFKSGNIGKDQYEAFRREVIDTEQALKSLKKQAQETNSFVGKFKGANESISSAAGKVQSKTAPLTAGILGLGAAAVASVEGTEELRTDLSKLDQNAQANSVSVDTAREAWKKFAVATDETDSAVEATSNLLQAGFTESNLQTAMEGITGAYLRFPDTMKVESLADSLQETLATGEATGQFAELLDRLGINAEQFNAKLQGAGSQAEKQNLVLQTLASAGLNDTYNAWVQNNGALVENKQSTLDMQLQLAQLAETIQPLLTKITEIAVQVLTWFNNLSPAAKILIVAILGIIAAISPIAGIISAISAASAASPVTWIVLGIVAAVAALVAICIVLYNNWDTIKAKAQELWEKAKTTFSNIKAAADEAFAPIVDWISGVIEKAKKAVDWLKDLFGWKSKTDDDGGDGFGGAANGDTITNGKRVVGELGPELLSMNAGRAVITPLTTNRTATFNNTFNFTTPYSVNDGQRVVEQINRQLGRLY